MAASVNNIAATFAASVSISDAPPSTAAFSPSVSASWNPHRSSILRSHRSSLLSLYGLPAPLRPSPLPLRRRRHPPLPTSAASGYRLPAATLSYLDSPGAIRTLSLHDLTRRKVVILAVPGAFLPPRRWKLSPEELIRRSPEIRARAGGAATVACVAANDVHVMRAWGESLGAEEGGVLMLSDPEAELARALGLAVDLRGGVEGFGVRSRGYLMVANNGVVKALFVDDDGRSEGVRFDEVIKLLL
ncbi:peroxiredoxin-2E-1, chloroplastic-like [Typha angustifolia]|uniref:peroxiredoxin-2E-1, chloroplastic-like n=1 Tax=Typha angustifolia TaxID=59011 RepID=UPI003C2BCC8C